MSTSVRELKKEILEHSVSLSVLLRKAIVLARKRNDTEAEKWMMLELTGVPEGEKAPPHRILGGQAMLFNRWVGWEMINLQYVQNKDFLRLLTSMPIFGPISEIEAHAKETSVTLHYGTEAEKIIEKNLNKEGIPGLLIAGVQFQSLLETIRNKLFDWVSQLPDEPEKTKTIESENQVIMPDKITLKWLWHFVPVQFWLWFFGLLGASFVSGVFVGQLSIVQELVNKKTSSRTQNAQETPRPATTPTPSPSPTASK